MTVVKDHVFKSVNEKEVLVSEVDKINNDIKETKIQCYHWSLRSYFLEFHVHLVYYIIICYAHKLYLMVRFNHTSKKGCC